MENNNTEIVVNSNEVSSLKNERIKLDKKNENESMSENKQRNTNEIISGNKKDNELTIKKGQMGIKSILGIILLSILFYFSIQKLDLVVIALSKMLKMFFPFILGGAIAFILNVPMQKLEDKVFRKNWKKAEGMKRLVAFLITLVGLLGVIFIAMFVVVPELGNTIINLIDQIPNAIDGIQKSIMNLEVYLPMIQEFSEVAEFDWDSITQDIVSTLQNVVTGLLSSTLGILTSTVGIVGSIVSGVMTFIIGFTFSIYVLFQKEKLARQGKKVLFAFLPEKIAEKIIYIGKLSNTTFSNFLSGQCLEAVILGAAFFIFMTLFKLPYALLIGILISVTALIPIFGAFIGLLIGAFLIVMVNPMQALVFIILFLVLQQLEGNLIYPYVVGDAVGLPSIWVLFAVTIGGKLMGVAGMLIFIPIFSICYTLFKEVVYTKISRKGISNKKLE